MVCITDNFDLTFDFYNYVKKKTKKTHTHFFLTVPGNNNFFLTVLAILVTQGRNATLYDIEGKVYV